MYNPDAHGEPSRGPGPVRYDPLRYARHWIALDVFRRPDTTTEFGRPTDAEFELAYAGKFDDHPDFDEYLAATTRWCEAASNHGGAL